MADIDDLIATYRTAGLPVVVKREGSLPRPDAAQLVIYRTVQEGLTNALRYAVNPTRVEVALSGLAEATVVQVSDDGVGTAPASSVGTERGLIGLRERAALFGGTIEAGPRIAQGGADGGSSSVCRSPERASVRTPPCCWSTIKISSGWG